MALAKVVHRWTDGDSLRVEIEVEGSYPDAVAEAKAQALNLYSEALGVTIETLGVILAEDTDTTED